jgi:hypothetical protein
MILGDLENIEMENGFGYRLHIKQIYINLKEGLII